VVIFGEYDAGAPARMEVRALADYFGKEFITAQGMVLGRAGQVRIAIDHERIQVGGMSVTCIDGQLAI
jgi:predicted PhzF superfamily epimerase YddE/YHI9